MFGYNKGGYSGVTSDGHVLSSTNPIIVVTDNDTHSGVEATNTGSVSGMLAECTGNQFPTGLNANANGAGAVGINAFASGEPFGTGGYDNSASAVLARASGTKAVAVFASATGTDSRALFLEGDIATNRSIAHVLGAYSGNAVPIFDIVGNLIGYFPLYN